MKILILVIFCSMIIACTPRTYPSPKYAMGQKCVLFDQPVMIISSRYFNKILYTVVATDLHEIEVEEPLLRCTR